MLLGQQRSYRKFLCFSYERDNRDRKFGWSIKTKKNGQVGVRLHQEQSLVDLEIYKYWPPEEILKALLQNGEDFKYLHRSFQLYHTSCYFYFWLMFLSLLNNYCIFAV